MPTFARARFVPAVAALVAVSCLFAAPSQAVELLCPGAPAGVEYFCGEDVDTGQDVRPGQPPALARVAFLERLMNVGNEDFEEFPNRSRGPFGLSFPGTAGELTGTLAATGEGLILRDLTEGRFPTSGQQYMQSLEFSVTFSQPVAAFGFYATDVGDYGANLKLEFYSGDEFLWSLLVGNTLSDDESSDAALLFLGTISSLATFDRVDFVNVPNAPFPLSPFDAFGFDDLVIADSGQVVPPTPIPEPAALGVVLLAGLVLALTGRPGRPTL
jgi:hypothetical protein